LERAVEKAGGRKITALMVKAAVNGLPWWRSGIA
jgi:hypothetical protein